MENILQNKIGYARVSTISQNLDSQLDALAKEGRVKVFSDKITGIKEDRPNWNKMFEYLRPGDAIVVTELSRMTRSLMHLLKLTEKPKEKHVDIISLREE